MRSLGKRIHDTDPLDAAVAERLTDFWEARLQAVQDSADPSELAEFGEWFATGKLGDEWELSIVTSASLAASTCATSSATVGNPRDGTAPTLTRFGQVEQPAAHPVGCQRCAHDL
jgi:hypothetical protein